MKNSDKMRITADIVISIMANSTKNTYDRLDAVPAAIENIYKKISELVDENDNTTETDEIEYNEQVII